MRAFPFVALALLALPAVGCSRGVDDDATAISADDQRQLNDAAAMLDANSVDAHTPDRTESSAHD